jgi:2-hydroxy-6-oxonona-2,4-dienedioate hydrolase
MALALTEEETSRVVQTASGKIHYNEAGEGHPVILLHGSGPGATGWSNFGPNLKVLAETYRVLAPDMPGWGKSDTVSAAERDHVTAALHFMDELGLEKATFVGNSMGGATTLGFAIAHPERMSHLITMGAGSGSAAMLFGAGDGPTEGLKILQQGYRDPSPETMGRLVDIMTFDSSSLTDELAQQRSASARSRPDHVANFLAGLGQPRKQIADAALAGLTMPALIVHGRDDRVVHYEHGLRLVSLIPNSRLVLFNRCGHWAQLEHAAEFNRLVDQFISAN